MRFLPLACWSISDYKWELHWQYLCRSWQSSDSFIWWCGWTLQSSQNHNVIKQESSDFVPDDLLDSSLLGSSRLCADPPGSPCLCLNLPNLSLVLLSLAPPSDPTLQPAFFVKLSAGNPTYGSWWKSHRLQFFAEKQCFHSLLSGVLVFFVWEIMGQVSSL